jgi:hypothetical protein
MSIFGCENHVLSDQPRRAAERCSVGCESSDPDAMGQVMRGIIDNPRGTAEH